VLLVGANLRGLPIAPLLIISATAVLTFLALVTATALVLGEGRLTWFHHHVAVLATTGVVMAITHWPVLAYLDLVATALLAFNAVSRIGCLLTGCCHGRPSRSGIVYQSAHTPAGIPLALIGVPVLPVQLIESMIATALTTWCLLILASPAPAGTALGLSLAGYALARFWLETARGDRRLHAAGLSEAQWTATGIATILVLIGLTGAHWIP
jgi:prolipoprotein diacylglyceryltransferase